MIDLLVINNSFLVVNVTKGSARVYYTPAVWQFKSFLSVGLLVHSYLSGGLQFRNYWRFQS